ncbi:TetR/AcrR family transcriptional regulator C-terminal domain-containing protein [Lacticaseibacillus camelliae]|uniref:TetR/AcrR family transcriptional regulator C-terminal domain-containing protein n=1 Tax=Lacticaseibacillus camelliae TaxID=381742 RepID=UPI000704A201|nr:TetR/AcrR family transcriptional regulator C-terminal domain-containing protein [Lacticaseibacillus camelliae]
MPSTKDEIARVTKQLVITMPFKAITVTTIMAATHMRRQTFYDHFRDKYEVLGYIYRTEIDARVWYCGDYRRWPDTLHRMVQYFTANRLFYQKALAIDDQNAPSDYIQHHLHDMIDHILRDLATHEKIVMTPSYQGFVTQMLVANAFTTIQLLLADSRSDASTVEENLRVFVSDALTGLLDRYRVTDNQAEVSG